MPVGWPDCDTPLSKGADEDPTLPLPDAEYDKWGWPVADAPTEESGAAEGAP